MTHGGWQIAALFCGALLVAAIGVGDGAFELVVGLVEEFAAVGLLACRAALLLSATARLVKATVGSHDGAACVAEGTL